MYNNQIGNSKGNKRFAAMLTIDFCVIISDRVYEKREEVVRYSITVSDRVYEK